MTSWPFSVFVPGVCKQGGTAGGGIKLWDGVREMTQILSDPIKHTLSENHRHS